MRESPHPRPRPSLVTRSIPLFRVSLPRVPSSLPVRHIPAPPLVSWPTPPRATRPHTHPLRGAAEGPAPQRPGPPGPDSVRVDSVYPSLSESGPGAALVVDGLEGEHEANNHQQLRDRYTSLRRPLQIFTATVTSRNGVTEGERPSGEEDRVRKGGRRVPSISGVRACACVRLRARACMRARTHTHTRMSECA